MDICDQEGYSVRLSRRACRVSIRVSPGRVLVTAPPGTDREFINAFVASRENWIKEKLAFFNDCSGPLPLTEVRDGTTLWLFGKEVSLQQVRNQPHPALQGDRLLLGSEWFSGGRLSQWLDDQLLQVVTSFAHSYSEKTGMSPERIRLGNARTRWGSCNAGGVVMMNRKLVHAPLDVIEYVLIHELVHLRHRNHSRLFWGTLEQYLGEVKSQRKWLRLQGALLI
ncbi:MAG: M48 family metallopeptidase [Candidatus Sabulitectum sp.]|nr:M48 family metallopeptidase [Candidatus Sabulitectum sp.]